MPLHPEIRKFLSSTMANRFSDIETNYKQIYNQSFEKERTASQNNTLEVLKIENMIIPGPEKEIPIRIYTPKKIGPFSLLVFFHGGGYWEVSIPTILSVETYALFPSIR